MKRQIQNFTEVTVMRVANKNVIKLMKVYFYPRAIASPQEDSRQCEQLETTSESVCRVRISRLTGETRKLNNKMA